jgi:hypothetical protein
MAAVAQESSNAPLPAVTALGSEPNGQTPLLTPSSAWRVLCHRTGIPVSRATVYRWLNNGRVFSFRLGQKFYVPMPIIDEIIKHCQAGERF